MIRNYNQHSREIVELKSGSNSQKENTNGNKCLFSQAFLAKPQLESIKS